MKKFIIFALIVFVIAVAYKKMYPTAINPDFKIYDEQALSSQGSSWAESSSVVSEAQTVTITDQAFDTSLRGHAWLTGIGVKKLKGNLKSAFLHVVADSPVGMYVALSDDGIPYEAFGSRLKYLQSEWVGSCRRVLAKSETSFNVDFSRVNVAKGDDGCATGMETFDLTALVNADGIYLGFMTVDGSPAKVTLTYEGDVEVGTL